MTSVEAADCQAESGMPRTVEGKQAVLGKNQQFFDNIEIHSASVAGPFPHQPDHFALILKMDATCTQTHQRMNLEEVAVYTVANGKIVKEEFFYDMPGT